MNKNVIKMEGVDINKMLSIFGPALKCDSKIGFVINGNEISYLAAHGQSLFKHFRCKAPDLCANIINPAVEPVIVFIFDGSAFRSTMKQFENNVNIDFNYTVKDPNQGGQTVVNSMRLHNTQLRIDYACANLSLGYQNRRPEDIEYLFNNAANMFSFELTSAQLGKIDSLNRLNNLDTATKHFSFKYVEGKGLVAEGNGYEWIIDPAYNKQIEEVCIDKDLLHYIDSHDYVVEVSTATKRGSNTQYKKAVLRAKNLDLQTTFTLLKSVAKVSDAALDSEFENFKLSTNAH